jgi:hypothetical protein
MLRNSSGAAQLAAEQKRLSSIELVTYILRLLMRQETSSPKSKEIIILVYVLSLSRDSSVCIEYGLEKQEFGVQFPAGTTDLSLLYNVQTSSTSN